jgi:phage/plasmid-like protein (TIGR03299 family)
MAHNIETMAWTGDKPWHGLGVEVKPDLTPLEIQKAAQLDWTVSKRPAYTLSEPEWHEQVGVIPADGHYFITRDSDNRLLSHCGDDYIPIQNEDIFKFFKKFTEAGHMTMETAGSLREGSEIWGLAKIAKDFKLAGGDEVQGYLLINQPHVAGKAMVIKFTPIRVVCNNTLTMALDDGGAAFRMPHIKEFDGSVQQAAEEALGLSEKRVKEFQEQAEFLASKQFKTESVMNYIAELYQPNILVEKAKAGNDNDFIIQDHFNKTSELVLSSIDLSPGATMKSAKGTWWGALNGATYIEDHHRRSTAVGNSLHSAWFGAAANRKAKALSKALEYAEAA